MRDRIVHFFQNLSAQSMHLVDEFYTADAEFTDPVVHVHGTDQIRSYYQGLYSVVQSIHFDFSEILESGSSCAAIWTMTLTSARLNRGRPVILSGVSHLHFDPESGKVAFHRDYFDMGAFIYEHVPILGLAIRAVKSRLH